MAVRDCYENQEAGFAVAGVDYDLRDLNRIPDAFAHPRKALQLIRMLKPGAISFSEDAGGIQMFWRQGEGLKVIDLIQRLAYGVDEQGRLLAPKAVTREFVLDIVRETGKYPESRGSVLLAEARRLLGESGDG
jgi:hypothetical protein